MNENKVSDHGGKNKGKGTLWDPGFSKEISWRIAYFATFFLFGACGFFLQLFIYRISPPDTGTVMDKLVKGIQLLGWEQGLLLLAVFEGAYERKWTYRVTVFIALYGVIVGTTLYKIVR